MTFDIEIEITMPYRVGGLLAEPDPHNNRKFIAKGIEPGNYQVTAYTLKYKSPVSYYQQ